MLEGQQLSFFALRHESLLPDFLSSLSRCALEERCFAGLARLGPILIAPLVAGAVSVSNDLPFFEACFANPRTGPLLNIIAFVSGETFVAGGA